MAAKLRPITRQDGSPYGHEFVCPGCEAFFEAAHPGLEYRAKGTHMVVTAPGDPRAWGFNSNVDSPTFTPSVLVYEVKRADGTVYQPRCHSFVTDGRIQYLADCGHTLAGQTVDLPDVGPSC
ncbi:MAG: hypothetical protein NVS3B10_05780 [Polyangiales bacterium]